MFSLIDLTDLRKILNKKGVNADFADCFLKARIFNMTNEDHLDVECFIADGADKAEATLKVIAMKKKTSVGKIEMRALR